MAESPLARFLRSRLGTVVVLAATTALVLGGVWVVQGRSAGVSEVTLTGDTAAAAPAVGEAAPGFTAVDAAGDPVALAAFAGRPVWLVFGATWCSNCRTEAEDIQAVREQVGDDVAIVAVYVGESATTVADYAARLGLTYQQVPDPATALGSAYRVMGIPTHYFLTADGTVADVVVGAVSAQLAQEKLSALKGS